MRMDRIAEPVGRGWSPRAVAPPRWRVGGGEQDDAGQDDEHVEQHGIPAPHRVAQEAEEQLPDQDADQLQVRRRLRAPKSDLTGSRQACFAPLGHSAILLMGRH